MKQNRVQGFTIGVISLGIVIALTQAALGFVQVGDTIKFDDGPGDYNPGGGAGGSFWLKEQTGPSTFTRSFQTFCVEASSPPEYLDFSNTFFVYDISGAAILGGTGGGGVSDPLDTKTAYIFQRYYDNNLAGVNNKNDIGQNNAVQAAIWYIEQEISATTWNALNDGVGDPTWGALAHSIYNDATSNSNGTLYNVRVINSRWTSGTYNGQLAQSVLTVIPEASTILGWLMMAGVFGGGAWWRRRK